jgi:hypothetical protein
MKKRKLRIISQEHHSVWPESGFTKSKSKIEIPPLLIKILKFAKSEAGRKIIMDLLIKSKMTYWIYDSKDIDAKKKESIYHEEIISQLKDYLLEELKSGMWDKIEELFSNMEFTKAFTIFMQKLINKGIITINNYN